MNRHEYREKIVFALYQHLLLKNELQESFDHNFNPEDYNDFLTKIINDLKKNIILYKNEINGHLKKWSFERLNLIDQAILLEACSELKQGLNEKAIIIDEAIKLSKTYSDEDSYKYINGVLDKL